MFTLKMCLKIREVEMLGTYSESFPSSRVFWRWCFSPSRLPSLPRCLSPPGEFSWCDGPEKPAGPSAEAFCTGCLGCTTKKKPEIPFEKPFQVCDTGSRCLLNNGSWICQCPLPRFRHNHATFQTEQFGPEKSLDLYAPDVGTDL